MWYSAVWFRLAAVLAVIAFGATNATAESIVTVAGTGKAANNGDDGPVDRINIGQTFGVEFGPDGALYICEVENHRVRRLDLQTRRVTTVAGNGQAGYSGDGGPATAAAMNEPYEVRFDAAGNMFVVEMQNHVVRRVDAGTGRISTIAGTGKAGFSGDDGLAVRATFRRPHSIALHGEELFIADIGNHRIRKVDLQSGIVRTIAGDGSKQLPREGPILGQSMVGPRALYVTKGMLWIALREGHSIWRLNLSDLRLTHIAGSGQKGYTGDGGSARTATFNGPKGIVVDDQHRVLVVDTENQVIRRIDTRLDRVTTLAGNGNRGYGGDSGPANQAKLDRPHGICLGPDGTVYIGDTNNHRVRAVRQP